MKSVLDFCRVNINILSVEAVHHFLLDDGLPKLLEIFQKERGNVEMSMKDLLSEYGLRTLNVKTIQNWMKKLGFKYEPRKKTYYVDTHESKENVAYRAEFINSYFEYETLAHRWYSITAEKRKEMIQNNEITSESGYRYEKDGQTLYEYHVDDHPSFQLACNNLEFGGNLSVRFPEGKKPVIILGQDEAIMKQNLFTLSTWTLPDGSKPLIPKDEGYGVMLSAFTSRELGFGFDVPKETLAGVNKNRKGNKYSDETAAKIVYGKAEKHDLESSPFVIEFEYGQNKEGYWNYDHMVLQIEDCANVLQYMCDNMHILPNTTW